jgi:hypothetical protein
VDDAVGSRDLSSRLDEALGIYRGDFMEGFSLEIPPSSNCGWRPNARGGARFSGSCARGHRGFQVEAGRLQEAIGTTRIWTKHAPLEEAAHRRLVEALSSAGDSEGALLAYEHFRGALEGELGIEPSPQMKGLNKRLQREIEGRASFDASLTRSARTASLAALDVPFAGRREEFGALVSEYHAVLEEKRARWLSWGRPGWARRAWATNSWLGPARVPTF